MRLYTLIALLVLLLAMAAAGVRSAAAASGRPKELPKRRRIPHFDERRDVATPARQSGIDRRGDGSAASSYNQTLTMLAFHYAKAAYCEQQAIRTWTCPSCNFEKQLINVSVFSSSLAETQGYSGYDPVNNYIIVAFRGTNGLTAILNLLEDINAEQAQWPEECTACQVHTGFLAMLASVASQMQLAVFKLTAAYAGVPVLVIGHSSGGAAAHLASVQLGMAGVPQALLQVVTFGQPRTGNPAFVAFTAKFVSLFVRNTHLRDPVPHVPPLVTPNPTYLHMPHEVFYGNDFNVMQYRLCADSISSEDPLCADSISITPLNFFENVPDHLQYFGMPTDCTPPSDPNPPSTHPGEVCHDKLPVRLLHLEHGQTQTFDIGGQTTPAVGLLLECVEGKIWDLWSGHPSYDLYLWTSDNSVLFDLSQYANGSSVNWKFGQGINQVLYATTPTTWYLNFTNQNGFWNADIDLYLSYKMIYGSVPVVEAPTCRAECNVSSSSFAPAEVPGDRGGSGPIPLSACADFTSAAALAWLPTSYAYQAQCNCLNQGSNGLDSPTLQCVRTYVYNAHFAPPTTPSTFYFTAAVKAQLATYKSQQCPGGTATNIACPLTYFDYLLIPPSFYGVARQILQDAYAACCCPNTPTSAYDWFLAASIVPNTGAPNAQSCAVMQATLQARFAPCGCENW